MARIAASGRPGTNPSRSARIASSVSGWRAILVRFRVFDPQSGRRSASSGRARVTTSRGTFRDHSRRCSTKSRRPLSAHWRSSKRSTVVPRSAIRSKKIRQAAKRTSRPPAGAGSSPRSVRSAGSTQRRSSSVGTCSVTVARIRSRVVASSSSSTSLARRRTISPSAQKVIPSPKLGERPRCHQIVSVMPSTYFSSSQARRLLPMPPGPVIETSRGRRSRPVVAMRSLSSRISSPRPTNGGSGRSARPWPPRWATTRRARQAGTGLSLPLRVCSPAASKAIAALAARMVGSPARTVPGGATA